MTSPTELSHEVYTACVNQAPHGWIADYVEYFDEHGGTFPDYLLFQVQQEEETALTERQDAGGYLSALLRYLHKHHPEQHPYLGTSASGHGRIMVELEVPLHHQDLSEYVRQFATFPDDVRVNDIYLEEE